MLNADRIAIRSNFPREISIMPALLAMSAAIIFALVWLLGLGYGLDGYPYAFLLPWIGGLAVVLSIPSVILYRKGRFTFADPLVFATFSYFFPAFVIGGIVFAFGWSQPEFISFVQDADYNLPLTIVLVGLGFSGLASGYFLPIGERLGGLIGDRLPTKELPLKVYVVPGILILVLGVINSAIALTMGLFGFQRKPEFTQYDGLLYTITILWVQGSFLLWYLFFRTKRPQLGWVPVLGVLLASSFATMLFSGNRGSVIQIFTFIALAYILSGRDFKLKQATVAGALFCAVLTVTMIYGSMFRAVKGTEAAQGVDLYTENVVTALGEMQNASVGRSLEYGFSRLAERIDILTTLAVVVSNHEALKPYEAAYGLEDNIWVDLTTFVVPRVFWNDKPAASDPRKYSELYFNYGESSFAITPIGDLLRNYGVIGVPLGMMVLGMILRTIYRALVEKRPRVVWRVTLYFMLLTAISYEGFFGTIIPNLFKVFLVAGIGILLVGVFAGFLIRLIPELKRQ